MIVSALVAALVGTSTDELSAGDLLAPRVGRLAHERHHVPALFWMLDECSPQRRSARARHTPDFRFPQDVDGWMWRLSDYLSVHQRGRRQPTDTMPLTLRARS